VTSIELHACCARRRITHHYAQGMVEKIQIAKTIRYVLLQKSILIETHTSIVNALGTGRSKSLRTAILRTCRTWSARVPNYFPF
jgi:hypothetical protein